MSSTWDLEPLVDLGEDFDVPATGSWIVSRWSVLRRFRFAVPVCALLLLAAASVPAPVAPLRISATIPTGLDASAMIAGPDIFIYDISGGHNGIRAYRLDGGALQWSAVTPELATETTMQYVGGQVIVSMADTDASGEHTVAFDARTGRRLWTNNLGYAIPATGGVLVESAPRPPGYNYPGTVLTGTFQMVDARTGRERWSADVPVSCATQVTGPVTGPATALVELCSTTDRLNVIDLADGRTVASRHVYLGNPAENFILPPSDQMDEPQLVIADSTVLVAHANAPTPTIDAYAIGDLAQLWTGLPVIEGQDVDQCGSELCVFDGASSGSVVDLQTGKQIGLIPPRGAALAAYGSLVLSPVGQAIVPSSVSSVPSVAPNVSTELAGRPSRSDAPAMWLAAWNRVPPVPGRPATGAVTPIQILHDVTVQSCVQIARYLGCQTTATRMTLWTLPAGIGGAAPNR